MISTVPTPSSFAASSSQSDIGVSGNSDSMQYADSPSFASQLDQHLTQCAPQNSSSALPDPTSAATPSDATPSANSTPSAPVGQPTASAASTMPATEHSGEQASEHISSQQSLDASTQSAGGGSDNLALSRPAGKEKGAESKTTRPPIKSSAASPDTGLAPLLTAALAITNSVAPLPTSTLAGTTAAAIPTANLPIVSSSLAELGTGLAAKAIQSDQTASNQAAPDQTASLPPDPADVKPTSANSDTHSGVSGSAQPLIIPGVPHAMDSRAVLQTAAPGVVNALPQIFNTLSGATAANSPLATRSAPAIVNADPATGQASGYAAQTVGTAASTALPATFSPVSADPIAAVKSNALGSSPAAAQTNVLPASLLSQSVASQSVAAAPSNANVVALNGASLAAAAAAGLSSGSSNATNSPLSSVQNQQSTPQEKQADSGTLPTQRLEGIERLLTLGIGKTSPAAESGVGRTGLTAASIAESMPFAVVPRVPVEARAVNAAAPASSTAPAAIDPEAGPASLATALPNATPLALAVSTIASDLQLLQGSREASGAFSPLTPQSAPEGVVTMGMLPASVVPADQSSAENSAQGKSQSDTSKHSQEEPSSRTDSALNTSGDAAKFVGNAQQSGDNVLAPATSAPNGSSQIDRTDVVAQVTQHLEAMRVTNGSGEMQVHLTPENLGNVRITVSTHPDGVVARIIVESAQVQQAMDGAKEHLQSGLEARGLHVDSVEVSLLPTMSGGMAFTGQRNGQSSSEYGYALPDSRRGATLRANPIDTPVPMQTIMSAAPTTASRLNYLA